MCNTISYMGNVIHNVGFSGRSAGKEFACNAGDLGWIPGLGRSPGEGKSHPLQYFGLENSMGLQSRTRLSNFDFTDCASQSPR